MEERQHQGDHVLQLSLETLMAVLNQKSKSSKTGMLVSGLRRSEGTSDIGNEKRKHEFISQLVGDLGEMLLSAHRNIVLRDHFIDQFLGPLLKRVLLDLRKHSHIGRHHFFLEIFALSDRGVMLVAENEHSRHGSASQVDQKARSLHYFSIDHEQVGENRLDELRMSLDQLVQTL